MPSGLGDEPGLSLPRAVLIFPPEMPSAWVMVAAQRVDMVAAAPRAGVVAALVEEAVALEEAVLPEAGRRNTAKRL
jgi:hypothetical protein